MNQLIEKSVGIESIDGKVFDVPRVMVVGNERFFPAQIINDLDDASKSGPSAAFVRDRAARFLRCLLKERESEGAFNSTEVNMTRLIDKLLKSDFWPNRVTTNSSYSRQSDVVDATTMTVVFNDMESASVYINGRVAVFSGKVNPNIRKALLVLAEAIRADNETQHKETTSVVA